MKIAIVDSNEKDVKNLCALIERYGAEREQIYDVSIFEDGIKFLHVLNEHASSDFDVVFMEVDIPFRNGFLVAEDFRKHSQNTVLIFYTYLSQYAIRGYRYNAADYLLKPLPYSQFKLTFDRVLNSIKQVKEEPYIFVKRRDLNIRIYLKDIKYVEVIDHKCIYHLINRVIERYDKLSSIAEQLEPNGFAMCSPCYLVNLRYVTEVSGGVVQIGDSALKMTRSKSASFLEQYRKYLG